MAYRATGMDRDSYISGARGKGFVPHDVNARRDNLPDNVFQYLKDQVAREQYEHYIYENGKANNQLQKAKSGRRIQGGDDVAEEMRMMRRVERSAVRHQQLKELYASEMLQWEKELNAKGFALDKAN